jgi:putative cell wall-binding protein
VTGWLVLALVVLTAGVATAGFATVTRSGQSAASTTVRAREPQRAATVVTGSPAIASASAARALLAAAPSVVLVGAGNQADVVAAAAIARRAHAPLLLLPASGTAGQVAALRSTIRALAPSAVLALGVARRSLAADLPGVQLGAAARGLLVPAGAAP